MCDSTEYSLSDTEYKNHPHPRHKKKHYHKKNKCKNTSQGTDSCNRKPIRGPTGPQGHSGRPGCPGEPGPEGPRGCRGPKGPRGFPGITGPSGRDGNTGPSGRDGNTGPSGRDGNTGPTGPSGRDGPTGPAGRDGNTGPTGPSGRDGPTGPSGPTGRDGNTGPTGRDGNTGPTGISGQGKEMLAGRVGGDGFYDGDIVDVVLVDDGIYRVIFGQGVTTGVVTATLSADINIRYDPETISQISFLGEISTAFSSESDNEVIVQTGDSSGIYVNSSFHISISFP